MLHGVSRRAQNLLETLRRRIGATGENPLYRGYGAYVPDLRSNTPTHIKRRSSLYTKIFSSHPSNPILSINTTIIIQYINQYVPYCPH